MEGAHQQRVFDELKSVGVTSYGMKKFAIQHLPTVIHEDEHIMGVVYGRYHEKSGGPPLSAGLLVATDWRIIFLDHKPGFTTTDEITYEIVSGVNSTKAPFRTAVTLLTRATNYTITYANPECARKFVRYVSKRSLEARNDTSTKT